MGIIIRSSATAVNPKKIVSAVNNGLLGAWFFDTDSGKLVRNFAISANSDGVAVGVPVVSSTSTQFVAGTSFVQTAITEPDDFTIFIVLRSLYSNAVMQADGTKRAHAGGNYAGFNKGITIGFGSPSDGRLSFGRGLEDITTSAKSYASIKYPSGVDPTLWQLVCMRCSMASSGFIKLNLATSNSYGESLFSNKKPYKGPNNVAVGSAYRVESSTSGPVAVSQTRIYDRCLSDDEMNLIFVEMRRYELTHNSRVV